MTENDPSIVRHILREKLHSYNTALDLLSQLSTTFKPFNNTHTHLIYDQIYILECLIYTDMKRTQTYLEECNNEAEKVQNS